MLSVQYMYTYLIKCSDVRCSIHVYVLDALFVPLDYSIFCMHAWTKRMLWNH